jgi:hypothetical protein
VPRLNRDELDARVARLLADALVAELRTEMAVNTSAPTAETAEAQLDDDNEHTHDNRDAMQRAS